MGKLVPPSGDISVGSSEYNRLIGPGVTEMTSLTNIRSGAQYNYRPYFAFTAPVEGVPVAVQLYFVYGSGYSGGTGGSHRVRIVPRKGTNVPDVSQTPLFDSTFNAVIPTDATHSGAYTTLFGNAGVPLVRGESYFLVVDNVDPVPTVNYCSVNTAGKFKPAGTHSRWLAPQVKAFMQSGSGRAVTDLTGDGSGANLFYPVFQIITESGACFGSSMLESGWATTPTDRTLIINSPVRQTITAPRDTAISGVSFAVACRQTGRLRWSVKQAGVSTALATGVLDIQQDFEELNVGSRAKISSYRWHDVELPANVPIEAGILYALELETVSGQFSIGAVRHGGGLGFYNGCAYTGGHAQYTHNGEFKDFYYFDHSTPRWSNSHFLVVFHEAEAASGGAPTPSPGNTAGTVASLPSGATIAVVAFKDQGVGWYWATVDGGRIQIRPGDNPSRATGEFPAIYVPQTDSPKAGSIVSEARLGTLRIIAGSWPVNTRDGQYTVLSEAQATTGGLQPATTASGSPISVGGTQDIPQGTLVSATGALSKAFAVVSTPSNNAVEGVFVWVRSGDVLTEDEAADLSQTVPQSLSGLPVFGTGNQSVPRWDARNFRAVLGPEGSYTVPNDARLYRRVRVAIPQGFPGTLQEVLNKAVQGGQTVDASVDVNNALSFPGTPGTGGGSGATPGGGVVPNAPGIITSSAALLERLMQGMANGHDIQYAGWSDGAGASALGLSPNGGAQTRGGAITMGGCLVPNQIYGSDYYNSRFDKGFSAEQMEQIRYRTADQLALWGCIMDDTDGSTSTKVQLRYGAIYMLFEGDDVWYKILEQGAGTSMASVTWTYDQGPDMAPGNAAHTAYSRQHNTRLNHQRDIGNGVYEILTPSGKYLNNHFGNGDHLYINNHRDKDFTKVRGIMGFWHIRLAPEHKGRVAGIQVGYDPKWTGIRPANWWPGGMLSRLQRIPDDWGTLGFISVNTAHDANRHSRSLSPAVIRGTTVEGFSA